VGGGLAVRPLKPLEPGDRVTILPPWDCDPVIVAMQHYGIVAEDLGDDRHMVELDATHPPRQRFGPFAGRRLAVGWRNPGGGWLLG